MAAKFYLYRNLNLGGFSIKHKGLVCSRGDGYTMHNVEFRVSEAGQKRARNRQARNVHAFAVADSYSFEPIMKELTSKKYVEVTYNPYTTDTFIVKETGEPIYTAERIITRRGRLYAKQST